MANPVVGNIVIGPIDGTATEPSISFGGGLTGNSGTGIYGSYGQVNFTINGVQQLSLTSSGMTGPTATYSGASSFQPLGIDLTLAAGAGKDIGTGTAFLAPIMGNVLGASLTKTGNYLAGVVGEYSITGAQGTTQQAGAVLGLIGDTVTSADGAFVAIIDGDSGVTKANAAFAARANNSTAGSGFNYGLDLYGAAHDGFNALAILKADVRMSNQVCILTGAGVPSNGTTGLNFAERGSLYVDITNGKLYITTGPASATVWVVVGSQS